MTPESAAADIVLRLIDLAADSRENAQTVLQALLLELVEQNRVPQYDLELRDCHEQIARLKRDSKRRLSGNPARSHCGGNGYEP